MTPKPSEWPPASLDLPLLTALTFYCNPELDGARAQVETAEADVVTAGSRVNPSLNTGGGYSNNPESALVFHFDLVFTIEMAAERAVRILQAQKLAEAARTDSPMTDVMTGQKWPASVCSPPLCRGKASVRIGAGPRTPWALANAEFRLLH